MRSTLLSTAVAAIVVFVAGCVTTALAPGADQVRIIRRAADVATCTAVGNVAPDSRKLEDARNLTVGLGGNALFVTSEAFGDIGSGVAYHCP
jgi:hypothetical protein